MNETYFRLSNSCGRVNAEHLMSGSCLTFPCKVNTKCPSKGSSPLTLGFRLYYSMKSVHHASY